MSLLHRITLTLLFLLAIRSQVMAKDPVDRPVKIMINWDELSLWRAQLNVRKSKKLPLEVSDVRKVIEDAVDEHAKARVDRLVYCSWARFNSSIPGFKSAPMETRFYKHIPGFEKLHAAGLNQLELTLNRCRKHGMQFLVCLRMNDRHGIAQQAKFWLENPNLRLSGYAGGLDYKHAKVRNGVLAFIKEVLDRYDIDGIELDYLRWCHMFAANEAKGNAHLLTDMTKKARALLDAAAQRRGRKRLLLAARVPQTFSECERLGMDVGTWIKKGYLDYVCPSDFFFSDFNMRVDRFVALCKGTRCKVYPAIHPLIQVGHPENITRANHRAIAKTHYADGAAGIATYNFQYNWRRWTGGTRGLVDGWPKTMKFMTEIKDPAKLGKDRHYLYYPLWQIFSPSGAVKYQRLLIDRQNGLGDPFYFRLHETDTKRAKINMQFRSHLMEADEQLAIRINGHPVPSKSVQRTFDKDGLGPKEGRPSGPFFLFQFPLKQSWLRQGENVLSVHLSKMTSKSKKDVVVNHVEVRVRTD